MHEMKTELEWISVEDRLPEEETPVMVKFIDGMWCKADLSDGSWFVLDEWNHCLDTVSKDPTHWAEVKLPCSTPLPIASAGACKRCNEAMVVKEIPPLSVGRVVLEIQARGVDGNYWRRCCEMSKM